MKEEDGFLQETDFCQTYPNPTHSTKEFENSVDIVLSLSEG